MIEDEIRDALKELDNSYQKIFEDYISQNFLESIAKVLCYIPEEKANEKIQEFPEPFKSKLIELKNQFQEDEDAVTLQILQVLQTYDVDAKAKFKKVFDVLNKVPLSVSKNIIDEELGDNRILYAKLRSLRITFSDIVQLSNRDIQKLLREVDQWSLAQALKMASDEVKEKIFSNMSRRAASMLKEDMEFMGPVAKSNVLEQQLNIVSILARLEDQGEIVFHFDSKEYFD